MVHCCRFAALASERLTRVGDNHLVDPSIHEGISRTSLGCPTVQERGADGTIITCYCGLSILQARTPLVSYALGLLATWFGRCRRVGLSTTRRPEPTRLQLLAAKETQPVSSSKSRVLTPRSLLMETILQAAIFRGGGCGCQAALDRQLLAAVPAAATYPRAALVH